MIKRDIKALFDGFHKGEPDISRLNYGIITLVPETKDANKILKFRPICLLKVIFNFFTKVLMNRLNGVAGEVVSPIQTAFIKGRYIMEGVLILHEALNSIRHKKQRFKVDLEKAYDKVKWPFVVQMLRIKGFPDKWIDWIMHTIRGVKCVSK